MLTVEEALDKILGSTPILGAEEKPILDCLGQVVSVDIHTPFNVPSNDNSAMEGDISFWNVRMKPGKPLAFGMFRRGDGTTVSHMGLPGNPVSSMVTFEVFARQAMYKMLGRTDWVRPVIKAVLENSVKNKDGRRVFLRSIVSKRAGQYYAHLTGEQGSGILTSMVKANALAIVPETVSEMKQGSTIDVVMPDWNDLPS